MLYASAYRCHSCFFIQEEGHRQTKVVKLCDLYTQMGIEFGMTKAYHSYFTKAISLSITIQITIHPLSTDGAIVI